MFGWRTEGHSRTCSYGIVVAPKKLLAVDATQCHRVSELIAVAGQQKNTVQMCMGPTKKTEYTVETDEEELNEPLEEQ